MTTLIPAVLVKYRGDATVADRLGYEKHAWDYQALVTSRPNPVDPGTWDWHPALQAAINEIEAGGGIGRVILKGGYYYVSDLLTSKGLVSIVGHGKNCTFIKCAKGFISGGSEESYSPYNTMTVRDLTVMSMHLGQYIGIDLNSAQGTGYKSNRIIIEDVDFLGDDLDAGKVHEWKTAIRLNGVDKGYLSNVGIKGKESSYVDNFDTGTTGIELINSTGTTMRNVNILRTMEGLRISGQSEGNTFGGGTIVAVKNAVVFYNSVAPANNNLFVDSHFSARECAIDFGETDAGASLYHSISDCFFLKRQDNGVYSDNYQSIRGSFSRSTITGCEFASNETTDRVAGGDVAILFEDGSSDNNLTALGFVNPGVALKFNAGSNNNRAIGVGVLKGAGNSFDSIEVENAGTGNVVMSGYSGSATPTTSLRTTRLSVITSGGETFRVLNGAASVATRIEVFGQDGSTAENQVATVQTASDSVTDVDLSLVPQGAGVLRFGTASLTADAPITGYIEIKDESGTVRKIALIS